MTTLLYAAYGSNLHPIRLGRRTPAARLLGSADIDGWALRFHKRGRDGSGKCTIVSAESRVCVAVYALGTRQKRLLDRIEGVGRGYVTELLHVPGYGDCWTYRASESHSDPRLKPYSWYKELVLIGCEAQRFPQAYVDGIRAVDSVPDPERRRHEEHMAIVAAARQAL